MQILDSRPYFWPSFSVYDNKKGEKDKAKEGKEKLINEEIPKKKTEVEALYDKLRLTKLGEGH